LQNVPCGELKSTIFSIQLADRSVKYRIEILEDLPLQVGKFLIPYGSVVMEIEGDNNNNLPV